MIVVKVLKRKDASSVVVAIVVALIVSTLITSVTPELAAWISGVEDRTYSGGDWQNTYLFPFVWAAVQLIVLELLAWVYVGLASSMNKK